MPVSLFHICPCFKYSWYFFIFLGWLTCFVRWRKSKKRSEKERCQFSEGFTKSIFQHVAHHDRPMVFWSYLERCNLEQHGTDGKWKLTSETTTLMWTPKDNSHFLYAYRLSLTLIRFEKWCLFAHSCMACPYTPHMRKAPPYAQYTHLYWIIFDFIIDYFFYEFNAFSLRKIEDDLRLSVMQDYQQ